MTASQYKNIIQWSLFLNPNLSNAESLIVAKKIFDNLGVALPNGDYNEIINVLKSDTYMGWRNCSFEDLQIFADIGVPAMAISDDCIIVILPNSKFSNFSYNENLESIKNNNVKHSSEFTEKDSEKMRFFAYSYGYILDKNK